MTIPHEHCLNCAPKRAKTASHQEPCYYCKSPTNEFEVKRHGCSLSGFTEYREFRHQVCADKAAAELAERNRIQQEQWDREWKEKHGDKPRPVITFVPFVPVFRKEEETLLHWPFPFVNPIEENVIRELGETDKDFIERCRKAVKGDGES